MKLLTALIAVSVISCGQVDGVKSTSWRSNPIVDFSTGEQIIETWAFHSSLNQVTITRRLFNDTLVDTTTYTYTLDGDAFILNGSQRVSYTKVSDNQNFIVDSYGGRNYAKPMHFGRQF